MQDEFKEYSQICFNFYKLDFALSLKAGDFQYNNNLVNNNFKIQIKISEISNFLIKINKLGFTKSQIFTEKINISKMNFNSMFISMLNSDGYAVEALTLSKNILTFIYDYEELHTQLTLLLTMGLINLGYQFVNNCFANKIYFSEEFDNKNDNLLDLIVNSPEYEKMKKLYFELFNFLIKNGYLNILFTLPYNFFERSLLREFLILNKDYEELLIIYFLKLMKVKEADNCYKEYLKNGANNNSKILYDNLIDTLKFLYGGEEILNNNNLPPLNEYKKCLNLENNIIKEKGAYLSLSNFNTNTITTMTNKNVKKLANKLIEGKTHNFYSRLNYGY